MVFLRFRSFLRSRNYRKFVVICIGRGAARKSAGISVLETIFVLGAHDARRITSASSRSYTSAQPQVRNVPLTLSARRATFMEINTPRTTFVNIISAPLCSQCTKGELCAE